MKKRFFEELKKLVIVLTIGVLYSIIVLVTDKTVPCVFNEVTGLLCPGCGITRMILSILKLDFYSAYGYNKVLFLTLPVLIFIFSYMEIKYVKTGKRTLSVPLKVMTYTEGTVLILFGIIRNIK